MTDRHMISPCSFWYIPLEMELKTAQKNLDPFRRALECIRQLLRSIVMNAQLFRCHFQVSSGVATRFLTMIRH